MIPVQLNKLECSRAIYADPASEVHEPTATQPVSRASNVETLALAQPVFETLPRSSPVLYGIGTSIPDQLRQARDLGRSGSLQCRLSGASGERTRHIGNITVRAQNVQGTR
jgi:hypothetical protein